MLRETFAWTTWLAFLVGLTGIGYGVASARQSVSLSKGRQRLLAYLFAGLAILLLSTTALIHEATGPVLEVRGTIQAVQVRSEGKGHRTYLAVRLPGEAVSLNAGGTNPYFKPGQLVAVRYQDRTRSVMKAKFLSSEGKELGTYQGTDTWFPYWGVFGGLLFITVGIRKNRRDPLGAESA